MRQHKLRHSAEVEVGLQLTSVALTASLLLSACGESCFYPDKDEVQLRPLMATTSFDEGDETTIELAFLTNRRTKIHVYENLEVSISLSVWDESGQILRMENRPPMILPMRSGPLKEITVDAENPYSITIPVFKKIDNDGQVLLDFGKLGKVAVPARMDQVTFIATLFPQHDCAFNETPGYLSEKIFLRLN